MTLSDLTRYVSDRGGTVAVDAGPCVVVSLNGRTLCLPADPDGGVRPSHRAALQAFVSGPVLVPLTGEMEVAARQMGVRPGPWLASLLRLQSLPRRLLQVLGNDRMLVCGSAACLLVLFVVHAGYLVNAQGEIDLQPLPGDRPMLPLQYLAILVMTLLGLLRSLNPDGSPLSLRRIAGVAAAVGAGAWLVPPGNSADAYAYTGVGRLVALAGANPYHATYGEVMQDAYNRFGWWSHPLDLGPTHLPFLLLAGWASMAGVMTAVYLVKALWLCLHLATVYVLGMALPDHPRFRTRLLLYAVNPLILFEIIINGHPEAVLIVFTALAMLALRSERPVLAFSMALAAALSEAFGIVLVVGILCFLLQRGRWLALLGCVPVVGGVALVLKATLFHAWGDLAVLWPPHQPNSVSFAGAITNPDILALMTWNLPAWDRLWTSLLPWAGALSALWLWRGRNFPRLVRGQVLVLLFGLAVVTRYAQPWFWASLLPFSVFVPLTAFQYLTLVPAAVVIPAYLGDVRYLLPVLLLFSGWLLWQARSPGRRPWLRGWTWMLTGGVLALAIFIMMGLPGGVATLLGVQVLPSLWLVAWWSGPRRSSR